MDEVIVSILSHRLSGDKSFLVDRFVSILGLSKDVVERIVEARFPNKNLIAQDLLRALSGDLPVEPAPRPLQPQRPSPQPPQAQPQVQPQVQPQPQVQAQQSPTQNQNQNSNLLAAQRNEVPPNFFNSGAQPYSSASTSSKVALFRTKVDALGYKNFDYKKPSIVFELTRDKQSQHLQMMNDSFEIFGPKWNSNFNLMKKGFQIKMKGEEGIDWGGIQREWFYLFTLNAFRPGMCLFMECAQGTCMPSPFSTIVEDNLILLKSCGRAVGLAVFTNNLIGANFTTAFCKQILGLPISFDDLRQCEPDLHKNLSDTLNMDAENIELLCRTFSEDVEFLGQRSTEDLIPNGRNIDVTHENIRYYVYKLTQFKLYERIKKEIGAFLSGFYEVIPKETFNGIGFTPEEFSLMLRGSDEIDVDDWIKNMENVRFESKKYLVEWFVRILKELTQDQKKALLNFTTSLNRVPVRGFSVLVPKFTLRYVGSDTKLPVSHTCFNYLDLTDYPSYEVMKELLVKAITETGEGFHVN